MRSGQLYGVILKQTNKDIEKETVFMVTSRLEIVTDGYKIFSWKCHRVILICSVIIHSVRGEL